MRKNERAAERPRINDKRGGRKSGQCDVRVTKDREYFKHCQMPLRDLARYGLRSAYLVVRRATGNFTQRCFGEVLEEEAEFG